MFFFYKSYSRCLLLSALFLYSLPIACYADFQDKWEEPLIRPLVNFHLVKQREKAWDGESAFFPFLYEEYLGKRVQAKGFLLWMEYGAVLSQTPQIQSCCRHEPQKKDLLLIRWAPSRSVMSGDSDKTAEIVLIEGDLLLDQERPVLINAKLIPLKSPWEKAMLYLKRLFGL